VLGPTDAFRRSPAGIVATLSTSSRVERTSRSRYNRIVNEKSLDNSPASAPPLGTRGQPLSDASWIALALQINVLIGVFVAVALVLFGGVATLGIIRFSLMAVSAVTLWAIVYLRTPNLAWNLAVCFCLGFVILSLVPPMLAHSREHARIDQLKYDLHGEWVRRSAEEWNPDPQPPWDLEF